MQILWIILAILAGVFTAAVTILGAIIGVYMYTHDKAERQQVDQ